MNPQSVLQVLIQLHNRRLVPATVAIIRRRENGNDVPIVRPIVTLHDQLMCSCDQLQSVVVVECFGDVLAERVTGTTRRNSPASSFVRVRPKKVAHRAEKRVEKANETRGEARKLYRGPTHPSWGTSCVRSNERMWSKVSIEGERPPCRQKI